jgi:hypothetical protein
MGPSTENSHIMVGQEAGFGKEILMNLVLVLI